MVPEYDAPQIREVFVGRYRIIYRLSVAGTQVLTLWPTAVPLEGD